MHCRFLSSSSFEGIAGTAGAMGGAGALGLPCSPTASLPPMLNMAAVVSRTIKARDGFDIEHAPTVNSVARDGGIESELPVGIAHIWHERATG